MNNTQSPNFKVTPVPGGVSAFGRCLLSQSSFSLRTAISCNFDTTMWSLAVLDDHVVDLGLDAGEAEEREEKENTKKSLSDYQRYCQTRS